MINLVGQCRTGTGEKCGRDAPFRLIAPSGNIVPGCFMCREHAEECVREYAAKLGEHWTMLDVRTDERIDIVSPEMLAKVEKLVDPLAEAFDALRVLYDVQNGPPLLRNKDRLEWESAMKIAGDVLRKHNH